MSIYTEHLKELCRHARRLDNMTMTNSTFVELQRLEADIISACAKGYYSADKKKHLAAIAAQLHAEYREALDLNERVKAISREITQQRRKEASA